MEKYIGTYHKSSPFIQNLLKKQICSFEILWQNYPPPVCRFSQICHWTFTYICLQKSLPVCRSPPVCRFSKICHWTITYMCLQIPPLCRFSQICHSLQIYFNLYAEIPPTPLTCPCFVTVWEIYSAILLLCSCLYFTQWRTTMNYPTWRHHVNS